MERLTLTNEKGGVGKTALAVMIGRYAAKHGKRVLFIDLDVQGNGSDALKDCVRPLSAYDLLSKELDEKELWKARYAMQEDAKSKRPWVCNATPEIANLTEKDIQPFVLNANRNLKALEGQVDLVVIDTPPTLGAVLVTSLLLSESVLIPVEVETSSLAGAANVSSTVFNLRKINPRLKIKGIVCNKFQNKPRMLKNFEEISKHPVIGKSLLHTKICNRDSIAEALGESRDIHSIRKTSARKACQELDALGATVLGKLFKDFDDGKRKAG